jgi:hypothetical protein
VNGINYDRLMKPKRKVEESLEKSGANHAHYGSLLHEFI